MAKKQDVTVVSDLVGRGKFTVSAKGKMNADGVMVGAIPSTSFEIEVTYKDQIEKMEYAVPTSIICLQGMLREEYLATGKFAFAAGSRVKVGANGKYYRPAPLPTKERLMDATWAEKITLAEAIGLPVPQEWRDAVAGGYDLSARLTEVEEQSENEEEIEDEEPELKYDEDELSKLSVSKLKVLAQKEELDGNADFEGYDDLTKDELVELLAQVEK